MAAASKKLTYGRDSQGYPFGFVLPFPQLRYSATLATSTDTTLTVPGDAEISTSGGNYRYRADIICNTSEIWFAIGATAAVPAGASFAATSSIALLPNFSYSYIVHPGQVLHFITAGTGVTVSVSFQIIS